MSDYDAAFSAAVGGKKEASPYDAIMSGLMPTAAPVKPKGPQLAPMDVGPKDGIVDASMIAAGRTFDRIGAGLQQLYYGARDNDAKLAELEKSQAEAARLMQPLEQARPISTAIGSALPMMAIPIGGAGAGVLGMAGRAAAAGAVPEALAYGSLEERAKNAALAGAGGAVGGGIGYGLGKGVQAVGRGMRVDPQAQAAAEILSKQGIPVRPDQATGNRVLQNVNAALDNLPLTSGRQRAFRETQQSAFNDAAGRFIGQGGALDDVARGTAKDTIGRGYSEVAARNQIPPQNLFPAMSSMVSTAQESYSPRVINLANGVMQRMEPDGSLSGKAYKELDSQLGKAMKGGGTESHYIGEMRDTLRAAMRSSVRPEDAGKWAKLDAEYSALGAISKSVDEAGNVSPRKLYTNTKDKSIARMSRGELGELAKAARSIMPDQVANSGTAQRLGYQALLSGGGFGAGYLGSGGDWEKAALGGAGALGLPMAARSLLNNPAVINMLTKQRFNASGAAPIGGLLGAGAGFAAPSLLFPAAAQ